MRVEVRNNDVEQAMRVLKRRLQKDGVHKELKQRQFYEKPSEAKRREKAAAVVRARKAETKRIARDGF
jgi:small subunit ribosomal protein S21